MCMAVIRKSTKISCSCTDRNFPSPKKKQKKNYSTEYSHVVPHHSTDSAINCLTAQIGRDAVGLVVYGRNSKVYKNFLFIYRQELPFLVVKPFFSDHLNDQRDQVLMITLHLRDTFSNHALGSLWVALVKDTKKIIFLSIKQHSKSHSYVLFQGTRDHKDQSVH